MAYSPADLGRYPLFESVIFIHIPYVGVKISRCTHSSGSNLKSRSMLRLALNF